MISVELSKEDLAFVIDCVNDRRINALDLIYSDISLDAATVEDLDMVALEADKIQMILEDALD